MRSAQFTPLRTSDRVYLMIIINVLSFLLLSTIIYIYQVPTIYFYYRDFHSCTAKFEFAFHQNDRFIPSQDNFFFSIQFSIFNMKNEPNKLLTYFNAYKYAQYVSFYCTNNNLIMIGSFIIWKEKIQSLIERIFNDLCWPVIQQLTNPYC